MRFAVATAALASQALQASSTLYDKKHILASITNFNLNLEDEKKTLLSDPVSVGHRQNKQIRKAKRKRNLMISRPSGKASPLMNDRRKAKEATECDPNAPDMGILRCGTGNYCVESKTSSIGGVCSATNRRLQACSADSPCDTGEFCNLDLVTTGACELCPCGDYPLFGCYQLGLYEPEVGILSCINSCTPPTQDPEIACQEYDIDYAFYYCETFVVPETGTGNETGNETETGNEYYICSYSYVSPQCYDSDTPCCYSAVLAYGSGPANATLFSRSYYFTEPYSQNVTASFNDVNTDCEVSLNNEICNSCVRTDPDDLCFSFDCTNIPSGLAGNTCEQGGVATLIPVYSQCYNVTIGCNLCGYGGSFTNPNATFPGGYNSSGYTCLDLLYFSYYQTENETDACEYFQYYFSTVCCDGAPICNICGDNELVHYDIPVTVPDYGEVSCSELYYGGIFFGLFTPDECPAVSSVAFEPCCQEWPTCYVCPDDQPVTNPDKTIEFQGFGEISCEEIQEYGRERQIPTDRCDDAQAEIPTLCGCGPGETSPPAMVEPPPDPTSFPTPTPPAPTFPAPTEPPGSGSSYVGIAVSVIGISLALITYMAAT